MLSAYAETVNYGLKVMFSTMLVLAVFGAGTFASGSGLSAAKANEVAPSMVVAAKNSAIMVGADQSGMLFWSSDSGSSWTSSGAGLRSQGVTSVVWNGSHFVASSYFQAARSADGKTWATFLLPVGSEFDPGNLISDAEFFTSGTMSVSQVQAFLEDKVEVCRPGFTCLKDYRENTFARDASVLCNAYEGRANESAAEILVNVSQACGVSAEALIVLIQKEQSLITHTWPSQWRFDKATGYACPDTAPCDTQFFGFYNQVYNAAKQFKRYSNPPGTSRFFTWFPVGQQSQVRLHPNAACGTTPVTIKNQATAGLYYYTPYTPNSPAMVNISTSGDGCSAYGNRNFWRIYNFWFKKPLSFKTLVTSSRGVTMAIDQEGGVAVSRDTRSWTRPSVIPTVSSTNTVLEFGRTPDGDFAVLTAAGTAFQSEDGGQTWKTLPVQRREEQQNSVVTYIVQSGDTVWRIADANSVTVASVVEQNNLASNGATIFVGQELTITKSGVVSTITSPVIPDPSIVIAGGAPEGGQGETQQPSPAPESDASSTGQTPSPGEGSTESTPPASGGQSFPALQPLVVETRESTRSYVVKRGDTLWSIARSNSTSVSRLVSLNSIANPNRLSIGQSLLITGGQTSQQTFHRVQSGDTLPVIAVRRSLSLSELIRLNPSAPESGDIRDGSLVRIS